VPAYPALAELRPVVEAAIARDDIVAALAAIYPCAHEIAQEEGSGFRELIGELPVDSWHSDPQITAAMGTSYRAPGSPRGPAALGYFRAAEIAMNEKSDTPQHVRVAVYTGYAIALRTQGRLDEALAMHEHAGRLIEDDPRSPYFVTSSARHALQLGMSEVDIGLLDSASIHLEYAHGLAQGNLTRSEHVEALGGLAMIAYTQAELDLMNEYIKRARAVDAPAAVLLSPFGAAVLGAEILGMTDRHDFERTREALEEFAQASNTTEWEPFVAVVGAFTKALSRAPIEALDLLNKARQGYRSWKPAAFGHDVGELIRAEILFALDQGDEAFNILSALNPGERHSLCPARYIAQLRLGHGDLLGASATLEACDELGELHSPRTKMAVQLLRGAIEFERGNFATSDVNVDRAFHTMAMTGVRSPLRHVPAAILARITTRGLGRAQSPEVTRIMHAVVESTAGHTEVSEPLSERERMVLVYVERELTVSAIAAALYISPNTVKTHLRRLYRKLGVSTRDEAIRKARTLGLRFEPGGERPHPDDA
jgi:LuxR family maltose regulon positive regulatory protein